MGMFHDMMTKIFHGAADAIAPPDAAKPGQLPQSRVGAASGAPSPSGSPSGPVDVEANLKAMASKNGEKLDWQHSIVDLMKLVGMDSSITARKALAADLHYTGDTNDSAAMNIWLHKEVMKKLSENGGKVPDSMLAH